MKNNNNFKNSGKMMGVTDEYVIVYTAFKLCKNFLLSKNKKNNVIIDKKTIMNMRNKK